jgi:hypothetical protein
VLKLLRLMIKKRCNQFCESRSEGEALSVQTELGNSSGVEEEQHSIIANFDAAQKLVASFRTRNMALRGENSAFCVFIGC